MTNKWAMVTGASSGIGREFAEQLAREGYQVVLVARREDKLQEVIAGMVGGGHSYLLADLATAEGIDTVLDSLATQRCHLLVNNAGYSTFDPFYQTELSEQRKMLAVNCGAIVDLAHGFLRQAEAGDALINLSSIVAYLPTPTQPMYSASKAFIASFSECLWEEHRERGVYVMGLCPGITETEFIATATGGDADGQNMPAAMIQSTGEVINEALAALDKRKKAIVTTGLVNKLMLLMPRLLTRHRLIKVLSVIGDPENAL